MRSSAGANSAPATQTRDAVLVAWAPVVELVDASDSKSLSYGSAGSSPARGTILSLTTIRFARVSEGTASQPARGRACERLEFERRCAG